MYYLINFSGKINSIFLTQDNDAILLIDFSTELFIIIHSTNYITSNKNPSEFRGGTFVCLSS